MSEIIIKEVTSKEDLEEFIKFPLSLYRGNKQYVPDYADDVRNSFNPTKNHGLTFCDVQAFLAIDRGNVVGRIVGLINNKANSKQYFPFVSAVYAGKDMRPGNLKRLCSIARKLNVPVYMQVPNNAQNGFTYKIIQGVSL